MQLLDYKAYSLITEIFIDDIIFYISLSSGILLTNVIQALSKQDYKNCTSHPFTVFRLLTDFVCLYNYEF